MSHLIAHPAPAFPPHLPTAEEVHLWHADLDALGHLRQDFWQGLTASEQAVAAGMPVAAVRERWIGARAMLRAVLARYLGLPPQQPRFLRGPYGKPELAGDPRLMPAFNLTHCGPQVLLAVTGPQGLVGVDVEQRRRVPDWEQIAASCFHPLEVAGLAALQTCSPAAAWQAFIEVWTRKEAVVKALGLGLSMPLNAFRVSVMAQGRAQVLEGPATNTWTRWLGHAVPPWEQWCLQTLDIAEAYAATLAVVTSHPPRIQCWRYEPVAMRQPMPSQGLDARRPL